MTTTPPEKKIKTQMEDFLDTVDKMKSQFEMVLPEHITIEKFLRTIKTAAQMDPKLIAQDVNRHTLWASCLKAAQDGLMVDGREAALVIFRKNVAPKGESPKYEPQVQYMPMMAGILKKVRNSGELASISAWVVYKDDEFDVTIDEDGEHLTHKPKYKGGEITHVYAIAKTKDGGRYIEVMPRTEVETIRNVSRAKDSGPWKDWYGEMAKKTVVRRLSKRLPMSTDLDELIRRDDELFDLNGEDKPEAPAGAPAASRANRLASLVDQAPPAATPPAKAKPAPATATPASATPPAEEERPPLEEAPPAEDERIPI